MFFCLLLTVYLSIFLGTVTRIKGNPLPQTRVYYLAAVEEDWNYFPESVPLSEQQSEKPKEHFEENDDIPTIGNIYRKAIYREYTDNTYTVREAREPWLGILGPFLKAEVGDTVEIHLLNNISHPVSLHTHGAQYEKQHEGSVYWDTANENVGSKIFPGHKYVYRWKIPSERGPTSSDPNCMIWAYHSHIHGDTDIHTGLLGPLLICKPGFLGSTNLPSARSYVLLFLIFDENQSWYLDRNINLNTKMGNFTDEEVENLKENESFVKSNQMYSVNGLMHNTLPSLDACLGSSITWHLMGMGNEADIHAITFAGQPITLNEHRTDVVHLLPGKFTSVTMNASHVGSWAIKSEVGDHFQAGMQAHFVVNNCSNDTDEAVASVAKRTRRYFVAAEEVMWNYGPTGKNLMNNVSLEDDSDASEFFERGPNRIGGTYKKVLYKEYVDRSFNYSKVAELNRGLLGQTLRVEVGEILEVNFLNRANRPFNFQSTAFVNQDRSSDDHEAVQPGQVKIYKFFITEALGPASNDQQCISWRYFSNVDSLRDSYSGLNGFLLTCRPESLNEDGTQKYVDQEYALMFAVMDENESHYIEQNIALMSSNLTSEDQEDPDFVESNLMHSINGLMYGNLQGIDLCLHDNVSLHLMAIGHEVDLHVATFRGNAFNHFGNYKDTVELLPGSHITVVMKPDIAGKWLLQCQTNDHIKGGMKTFYTVRNCNEIPDSTQQTGTVREYFIAATEEEWNYAPTMVHPITGENLTESDDSKIFVMNDELHIGPRYKKVLFREYTDASFTLRTAHSKHLGLLGPTIKGEIGDTIKITFLNNASRGYNMKPHGLIEVSNETSYSKPVQPGETEIYTWLIPSRAGPSRTGFECTNWIYYSAVDEVKDTNSGLVGSLVVCNPSVLLLNNDSRKDVDKEFSILFTVMDENESWYLDENIKTYCKKPSLVNTEDEDFKESNLKHAINGRLFGSLEGLVGNIGDKVAWYLMGLGTEVDIHSAHFHGLTAVEKDDANLIDGHKEDVVDLLPGIFRTIEMNFDTVGSWMFHCHVDDHLKAGMMALVTVNS